MYIRQRFTPLKALLISLPVLLAGLLAVGAALATSKLAFESRDLVPMPGEEQVANGRVYVSEWPRHQLDSMMPSHAVYFEKRSDFGFFERTESCMTHDLPTFKVVDPHHIECSFENTKQVIELK